MSEQIHLFSAIETFGNPKLPEQPFFIAGHLYKTDGAIMVRIPADNGEFIADAPPVQDYSYNRDDYAAEGIALPDPGYLELSPCECINDVYLESRHIGDLGQPNELCGGCDGTGMVAYSHKPISIGGGLWLAWKYVSYLRQHLAFYVYPAKYVNKTGPVYYFTGPGFDGLVMGHRGPSVNEQIAADAAKH